MVEQKNTDINPAELALAAHLMEDLSDKGTVYVDGVAYAVGLMWQPLQNPDDPLPEVRESMEADSTASFYCLRSSATPQYGIGRRSLGHKEGQPSLAAAVASAFATKLSICAVFRVKEGWWFVAIRNDLILSEEDVLYDKEEDAQKAFFSMMAVPDWEVKIAPKEWDIEGTTQVSLPDLIRSTRKVRLVELGAVRKIQFLLVIALVVLILLSGLIYLVMSLWDTVFTPEKITSLPMPEVIKPVEPIPEKPKPWEKVVQLDTFLNKCWNNSYQLNTMTIPGWELGIVSCTPTGIQTNWTKSWNPGGRIAWLKSAINEYKISLVHITLAEDGNSATGLINFVDIPMVASVPALGVDQLRDELTDISQATNLPIQFSQQIFLDPPNNPDGSAPPNQQQYPYFSFSVVSGYTPWEWRVFFEKFSGLELLKIEYNPSLDTTNKWKYEGRIYAK